MLDGFEILEGTFPNHEDAFALIPKSHFIPGNPVPACGKLSPQQKLSSLCGQNHLIETDPIQFFKIRRFAGLSFSRISRASLTSAIANSRVWGAMS